MKRRIIIMASILAMGAIAYWLFTQPSKSLEVSVLWTPPYPEFMKNDPSYDPVVHGKERIVYRVYYVWNDECQDLPWWIVTDSLDGVWRVIEAANSDHYSTRPEDCAIFNDSWIAEGFNRIQRTRVQIFQHVVFGTDHAFSREKEALRTVQALIEKQEEFKRRGRDLFDAMSAYMTSHPEYGTFSPSSRDHFDEQFKRLRDEYEKQESIEKGDSEQTN